MQRLMGNKRKIFLDSSVIFSALFSEKGASYFILHKIDDDGIELQMSEYVIREMYKVLKKKTEKEQKLLFHKLFSSLAGAHITFVPNPGKKELLKLEGKISRNDVPILATALMHSDFLLTLDNEFFGDRIIELAAHEKLTILKPGGFLQKLRKNNL